MKIRRLRNKYRNILEARLPDSLSCNVILVAIYESGLCTSHTLLLGTHLKLLPFFIFLYSGKKSIDNFYEP